MRLLHDEEILQALKDGRLELDPSPDLIQPYSQSSAVQPSSVDLTIGRILVPPENRCAIVEECLVHTLRPGTTVLVETRERVRLAPSLSGFGFPPARFTVQGVLTTNPGHVDPGFNGRLSFTLINMGRDNVVLSQDLKIFTLLLFDLGCDVKADYQKRYGTVAPALAQSARRLNRDFLSFEARASSVAKAEIARSFRRNSAIMTLLSAVVGAIATLVTLYIPGFFSEFRELHSELDRERASAQEKVMNLDRRLSVFEERVDAQLQRTNDTIGALKDRLSSGAK